MVRLLPVFVAFLATQVSAEAIVDPAVLSLCGEDSEGNTEHPIAGAPCSVVVAEEGSTALTNCSKINYEKREFEGDPLLNGIGGSMGTLFGAALVALLLPIGLRRRDANPSDIFDILGEPDGPDDHPVYINVGSVDIPLHYPYFAPIKRRSGLGLSEGAKGGIAGGAGAILAWLILGAFI